ncbi:S41 family peptidase [Solitalea sp. MAHUQ-68]|uniref:S41 family peptidase n=1 Tax=Solitalea agri TaxID=2953739 RepID=A0A9X2EZA4_9SPHI|nr:S41 family peptidase [Solitalea agri]MCO4291797.1 S41 family peptidase [Solitalea agri]
MNKKISALKFWAITALAAITITYSCKKDDPKPGNNKEVNQWIEDNMRYLYYWTSKIPASTNKNLAPDQFFESLLYKTEDRFSWIQESAEDLENSLNGVSKSVGYEIRLYTTGVGSNIIGQILYVLPNSPAAKAGLKRGDIFGKINGKQLTTTNYESLLFGLDSFTITTLTYSNGNFTDKETKNLIALEIEENPVFLDSVYTINNKKIGYFVYNQFVADPGDKTGKYDKKMDEVFGKFKAQGVTDLVLDLRFNTGGLVTSSTLLASLIVKDLDPNKVFYKKEYNTQVTKEIMDDPSLGAAFFLGKFISKSNNIGANLNKLYVLTSNHTASASELLINGLRPYMPVFLIGAKTYGKNVGSITVTDETGKIKWGMQPIVTKSFNSLGQSDYNTGFVPDIEDLDNGSDLKPLGDIHEALLNKALVQITNGVVYSTRETQASRAFSLRLKELSSSIDRKPMAFKSLHDDYPKLKRLMR